MRTGAAIDHGSGGRSEPRDEVMHRVRAATGTGAPVAITIVNVSAGGLMARAERDHPVGETLHLSLPHAGPLVAEIRWSLGGRIGCRFVVAIAPPTYYAMLATMRAA